MNTADLLGLAAFGAALFFAGRLVGHAQGMKRREERIERDRAAGVKYLLDYINNVWSK